MIRKLSPAALVATIILAACGAQGAPRLEDPREILTQSVQAMADVDSVHFVVALDGDVNVAEMGGSMSLDGTELEGQLAMDGSAGQFSFAVPAFLGISGEMRIVGEEGFIKTSMTGPLWIRQPIPQDGDDPVAQAADPQQVLAELNEFFDKEGVELTKLEDAECGDETCYRLNVDIAGSVFLEEAGAEAVEGLGSLGEEGLAFEILVDQETLYMRGVSTEFEDAEMGSIALTATFDGFGDSVDVEAPPEDEVTDDPGMLPIP